jgi:hypothetical protein
VHAARLDMPCKLTISEKRKTAPSLLICNARCAANIQRRRSPADMSSSLVRRLALLCRGRQMIRRHGGGDLRLATVLDSRRSFATSGRRRGANEDFVTRFRENRGSSSSSIISTGDAARPASLGRPQQGGDRAPLPFFTWYW